MAYIIQSAAAPMPGSCWGVYKRIAVLEVEDGIGAVSMISARARGVRRVVKTWEKLNCGRTRRCAYSRAYREARELVARLTQRPQVEAMAVRTAGLEDA